MNIYVRCTMSYVGSPFKYDLFVSYARAEKATNASELLKWSLNFSDRVKALLRTSLNAESDEQSRVAVFVDRDGVESGDSLPEKLQAAVNSSALLLVLLSPYYPKSRWCMEELSCHFAKAKAEGRTRHCSVVYIQPVRESDWPERLKDQRGDPLAYRDLIERKSGLPVGIDNFEELALKTGIRDTLIELQGRLREFRAQLAARRSYAAAPQAPPGKALLYLHARPQDQPEWMAARAKLQGRAHVNPQSLPTATDDIFMPERRQRKLEEYSVCHGLALLRTNDGDIQLDVLRMYRDRLRLWQEYGLNVPWAIVDEVGGNFPVAKDHQVPTVLASNPEWPEQLMQTLGLSS
jgi:hypothetical protein